jgi:hypothetical protein
MASAEHQIDDQREVEEMMGGKHIHRALDFLFLVWVADVVRLTRFTHALAGWLIPLLTLSPFYTPFFLPPHINLSPVQSNLPSRVFFLSAPPLTSSSTNLPLVYPLPHTHTR